MVSKAPLSFSFHGDCDGAQDRHHRTEIVASLAAKGIAKFDGLLRERHRLQTSDCVPAISYGVHASSHQATRNAFATGAPFRPRKLEKNPDSIDEPNAEDSLSPCVSVPRRRMPLILIYVILRQ